VGKTYFQPGIFEEVVNMKVIDIRINQNKDKNMTANESLWRICAR
jgi:hypothetical protein